MAYDKQTLITYRIQRARDTVEEAKEAIERHHLQLAENRIYYGMFYMVQALALQQNFTTSRHTQLLGWFNKEFIHAGQIVPELGKAFQAAFEKRQKGDYDDFVTFSQDEVEHDLEKMLQLLDIVEKIILANCQEEKKP